MLIYSIVMGFVMSIFSSDPMYYSNSSRPGASNGQRTMDGKKKINGLKKNDGYRLPMGGGG